MSNINKYCLQASILPLILFILYIACINHVEPTEIGIRYNIFTAKIDIQPKKGWNITPPWILISNIDLRPIKVSVSSAGKGVSSKLIQFNPAGWEEFVKLEGFYYYWWYNRMSINCGYNEEHKGMKDILRGYAYSRNTYSFITKLSEI
jgi:hypothetical protein